MKSSTDSVRDYTQLICWISLQESIKMWTKTESEHNLCRLLKAFTKMLPEAWRPYIFLFQNNFKFTEQLQEQYRKLIYSNYIYHILIFSLN